MIDTEKLYSGRRFDIYAIRNNGKCLVREFLESLQKPDQKKVLALLKHSAEYGPPQNEEKFKRIKNTGLHEFKSYQIRIFCFFEKGRIIILTHGFIKKRNKTPKKEIEKAKNILKEYNKGRKQR